MKKAIVLSQIFILSILLTACASGSDHGFLGIIDRHVEIWFMVGLIILALGIGICINPTIRYYVKRFLEFTSRRWYKLYRKETLSEYHMNVQAGIMIFVGLILVVSSIIVWVR